MLSTLVNILEEEIVLYRTLLDISSCEREAMVSYSLSDINKCQKERQIIYLKTAHLKERRFAVLKKISGETGIHQEDLTISTIIEKMKRQDVAALDRCRTTLRNLVKSLSISESGNKRIAEKSLFIIDQSMKILTGFTPSDPVYLPNGAFERYDNPGCRVRKEA